MNNFLIILGILYIINFTWEFQINFGNYLKHTHPKSLLRKIWWSMCDQNGFCEYCILNYNFKIIKKDLSDL